MHGCGCHYGDYKNREAVFSMIGAVMDAVERRGMGVLVLLIVPARCTHLLLHGADRVSGRRPGVIHQQVTITELASATCEGKGGETPPSHSVFKAL